jgi:hypothetical protein
VPADNLQSQWTTFAVGLSGVASQNNVRFRFQFISGNEQSNNLYLDDINIGSSLGSEDIALTLGLSVYPNPSNGISKISFTTEAASTVSIHIYDVLGKEVTTTYNGKVAAGEQSFNVDLSAFAGGIYTIRLDVDGNSAYRKLIKN